jgi:HAD superfamily hydrolase (TIGR01549 family)
VSSVKAVLFDLDDTLFDHHHSMQHGLLAVHKHYPVFHTITLEELETTYTSLIDRWHLKVLAGELTVDEARIERFREVFAVYGETVSLEEAGYASHIYRVDYQAKRQLIAGADTLLKHLRATGVQIVIVTNSTVVEQHPKLAFLGIAELVDVLIISEEVGIAKPHRAIFDAALTQAGRQPNEVVMVGDSWSNDIIGAYGVGIRAVWLNRFGAPCPDASIATEINTLEPIEAIAELLLNGL